MLTPLSGLFLSSWSDVERWIEDILVPYLHLNPSLSLTGSARLQCTPTLTPGFIQADNRIIKKLVLPDLKVAELASQR